ncbi:MAG TPA: DoxX family protein [Gemmatimonadaceae bacterium]|jgi:hypothetical protein|nr:DoxX family protein [Gemmatimonadaceae bacterium]
MTVSKKTSIALWVVQGLLALVFLFTGSMKLILPVATLTQQLPGLGLFVRFIGVAEVCGALGLILPGLLHTRTYLTPLAGACLVILMSGATAATLVVGHGAVLPALGPFVLGILAGVVAVGRAKPILKDMLA